MLDVRYLFLDAGCSILDARYLILETGSQLATRIPYPASRNPQPSPIKSTISSSFEPSALSY
jgi:hypothetical protein